MKEFRGILKRVGAKEGDMIVNTSVNSPVGHVRVSGTVSVIEIGDTVLRDVSCMKDMYDLLDVGEDAILFVHFKNFYKPVILGVAYPGRRRGFAVPLIAVIANTILSLFLFPILSLLFGFMIGFLLGEVAGVAVMLGGFALTFYNAVMLIVGYVQTAAGVRRARA